MKRHVILLVLFLVIPVMTHAQVNPDSSRIYGKVVDQTNAPLPDALVTITSVRTGRSFTLTSDDQGLIHTDFVPSGTYTFKAEKEGYTPFESSVTCVLGQELAVTAVLVDKTWQEVVSVHSSVPEIPTTTADAITHIPGNIIESLPLNGRDYSDLIALVPQVVSDPKDRIHVGGGRGIFTAYQLDGVDNNSSFFGEERGGILPSFTLSQTAVAEFQVSQVPFSAQYGGSAGGVINAVTKGGSSQWKGEVFTFYKDDSFVEKDANGQKSDQYEQKQYGFAIGGPLSSRWFSFFSTDIQDYTHPTLREWDDPTHALEDPANQEYLSQFFNLGSETGMIDQSNDEKAVLWRLDGQLSPSQTIALRFNFSDQNGENLTDNYRSTGWSNNGIEKDRFYSIALHLTSLFSSSLANECIFHFSREERPREANQTALPEVVIGSWDASFGQKNYLPNEVDEDVIEVRDNLTFFWKNHTIRGGIQGKWSSYMDWFFRYQNGSYKYNSWDDFLGGTPYSFTQSFSSINGKVDFSSRYLALYLQDTYRWKNLTLNGGLRWESQSYSNPDITNPLLPESSRIPSSSNISPRLSFAWDIGGNGRRVLRGGWGHFVGTTPSLLLANVYLFNGVAVSTVYLTEGDPSMPSFPNNIEDPADLPAVIPNVYFFGRNFQQPEVDRTFLEFEQDLGHGWLVSLSGHYAAFSHLERKQDANLTILGDNSYSTHPRPDSDFKRKIQFLSDAWGRYEALTLQTRYRDSKFFFHAHYTYSKCEDNDSNERSSSTHSLYPEDQYDISSSWGRSDYDVPHRFVAYGTWTPTSHWTLSGQTIVQSGFPYTAMSNDDDNGDGYWTDRATWEDHHFGRNTFRQPVFKTVDLRIAYNLPAGPGTVTFMLDIFNLFHSSNRTTDNFTYTTRDDDGNVIRSDDFRDLTLVGLPRQVQLGIRYTF